MKKNIITAIILAAFSPLISLAQLTSESYAVEVSAKIENNPPSISLSWPSAADAQSWTVYRKGESSQVWSAPLASLNAADTGFTDNNVTAGQAWEYRIVKTTANYTGYGYIYAGIDVPETDYRGRMLLVFPGNLKDSMGAQIQQLKMDIIGDGWQVTEIPLLKDATVEDVRTLIYNAWNADRKNTRSLFLLGHVPVLYSGNSAIDGHDPQHVGAWPADMIYGDVDGQYTDLYIDNSNADNKENWNTPGDGKYDQDLLSSDMELQVGRVDMFNLPSFKLSETGLLKQYLKKDHLWRNGEIKTRNRALVQDNFGPMGGEAFAASGYKSFATMFGSKNVYTLAYDSALKAGPYMWSYGTGGGWAQGASGIITTPQFASDSIQTVFTMLFGSWFGDWGSQDNLLRAALANKGPILTDAWSGRPHWYFHHMALGETVGYSAWVSQNVYAPYFKSIYLHSTDRLVSAALMGDPTLRMHVMKPVSNMKILNYANSQGRLTWQAGDTGILGYNIFRAPTLDSPFVKINKAVVKITSFTDSAPANGNNVYMVREVKLQQSASGTYYNMSTGVIDSARIVTGIAKVEMPSLDIYPNPSNGRVKVSLPENIKNGILRVTDINGKIVFSETINSKAGNVMNLDLNNLAKGVYTVEIRTENNAMHGNLVLR